MPTDAHRRPQPHARSGRPFRAVAVATISVLALAPAAAAGVRPSPVESPTLVSPLSTVGGLALASPGVVVGAGVAPPPVVDAVSYVVADLTTGAVLAAKAAHAPQLPASTLKVLTALTLLPELDPKQVVEGSVEAASVDGSKAGIEPGLKYTVDLVFKAMMLQSGNDAAVTLALAAGGVAETVDDMNDVAHDLNALDTVARNPSGLDAPGQVSSAYDLALITREALQRQDFRTYITTQTAEMPGRDGSTYQIQNENRFLASYPGAIGVKNGYTTMSLHTFVGAAERDGRSLVVTVMRTEGRPEPVVASLMDWGFATEATAPPIGELVARGPLSTPSATATATALTNAAAESPSRRAAVSETPAAAPVAAIASTGSRWPGGWPAAGAVVLLLVLVVAALRLRTRSR